MKQKITVAVAGNPNVGKTTLFNALTGARQKVGNWAGVTVEKKVGTREHGNYEIEIVDLPGTYSLTAYSMDEVVARDFIINEKPDIVLQVVDSTNLERNMYLTTQLLELGSRLVLALNMSDLAESRGESVDHDKLQEFLKVPAIKTVASSKEGITLLLDEIVNQFENPGQPEHEIGYGKELEDIICKLESILEKDEVFSSLYPLRWLSVKLLEGDADALEKLRESKVGKDVQNLLSGLDTDIYEAEMADKRYEFIGSLLPQVCTGCSEQVTASDLIDKVVTNKYLGIPIFLSLMWGMFELTFAFATPFMDMIDMFFGWLGGFVAANIETQWLASLLGDGIVAGVGSVVLFVPNIFILFFILALLEGSGYLARAAFIMDRIMYSVGLQGKSFIPMLMGFGCSVPAIMATRTLEDEKDRLVTMLVAPFMSCGARLPVYVLLAGTFFGRQAGTIIFGLYVLGILVAIASAKLFRSTLLRGESSPFIMELPPYRSPSLKTSVLHMWAQGYLYLRKVGTVIVGGVTIIWLLASFPSGVEYGSEQSFIGILGHLIEPLVAPLGFDWKIAVSLVFGFVAKEVVVGSLGVLYGSGEDEALLSGALLADPTFTPAIALGLMVFTLLYVPCIGTVAVIKKESGSWRWMGFAAAYTTFVAWMLAFITVKFGGFVLG
ncbi:ferrous iron transport protein B [Methanohalophilus levihalophilus]|uniref:ferrous iron transport protein B n=1 Tax=Methanohalophilus levihalophilus TaxID=1431282 RepID=UPI001AE4F036|nr:ferrous iron transport protein B [Methanohalophilus levihalophilus]MBP2030704.1 ferrous iron transport protein B [Methanohalophilus levihalophilus]